MYINKQFICDSCKQEVNKYEVIRVMVYQLKTTDSRTISGKPISKPSYKLIKHYCPKCYKSNIEGALI